ncbi:MAG: DUF560 domain-containing protein [Acidobacteria bacterium]|nr:DUF560 domain-containing protein [Acidobacteriota bacterium]
MKNAIVACFMAMIIAHFALSQDIEQESEFVRLMNERSRLLESLEADPAPDIETSMRARLKEIEDKIGEMGIEVPSPPAPLMSEADRTDLPLPRPASPSIEGKRYRFDFGVSPSYADNYFQAVAGSPRQAAWLTNVSGLFQFALARSGHNQLSAGVDIQRNIVEGIDNADWNSYGARLSYTTPANQLTLQGAYGPRRLTFLAPEDYPGLATTLALGSDYSRRLTRRARARVFYRRNDVRYPEFDDRNLISHMAAGDARYQFHKLFIPGIGYEWTGARARSENYSYTEMTPVLLLGARFGRTATLNLRYRYRQRTYAIDDARASNFGRKDRRHDAYMYLNIALGKHLGLTMYGSYLQNLSTRAGRGFKAINGGATLRCMLPGK